MRTVKFLRLGCPPRWEVRSWCCKTCLQMKKKITFLQPIFVLSIFHRSWFCHQYFIRAGFIKLVLGNDQISFCSINIWHFDCQCHMNFANLKNPLECQLSLPFSTFWEKRSSCENLTRFTNSFKSWTCDVESLSLWCQSLIFWWW